MTVELDSITMTVEAKKKSMPMYNEVLFGVSQTSADEIIVVFHACRGAETARGTRVIFLARRFRGTDEFWDVVRVVETRFTDATLTSRRGAGGGTAPDHNEAWNSSLDRKTIQPTVFAMLTR